MNMVLLLTAWILTPNNGAIADDHPLKAKERTELKDRWEAVLKRNPAPEKGSVRAVDVHSIRGDALLFLERFDEAITEYEAMIKIEPRLDVSHWRLGIAYFYANKFQKGADQFGKYHAYDNIDRENGIWRFLCQYKAKGEKQARGELLKYEKDDRKPFPSIYRMYQGSMTAEEVLATIPKNALPQVRQRLLFYAELYVGMDLVVQNRLKEARPHLARSVSQTWAQNYGGGTNYMWHVARVQLNQVDKQLDKAAPPTDAKRD